MPTGLPMLRGRILISILCAAVAVGLALLKPLPGRADDATTPVTPEPTTTDATPLVPQLPVVKVRPKPTRTTQSHRSFGRRIVSYAERFRGIRYVYGGGSPRSGF